MGRVIALLDTNIIIDFLSNYKRAIEEVTRYTKLHASIITYAEVLTGTSNIDEKSKAKEFFEYLTIEEITKEIADVAIEIRAKNKVKLPDALIIATSAVKNMLLITRDEAPAFRNHPYIRFPYKIDSF